MTAHSHTSGTPPVVYQTIQAQHVNEGYTYWTAYDPFTGNEQMRIRNVPSGKPPLLGPSGEILILQTDL